MGQQNPCVNRRASTLLEVLLVVAGVGIMCGLPVPTVQNTAEGNDANKPVVVDSNEAR